MADCSLSSRAGAVWLSNRVLFRSRMAMNCIRSISIRLKWQDGEERTLLSLQEDGMLLLW